MAFLPLTAEEARLKNWDYVDVVLVTGDAYVDHPSFAAAVIGRVLESEGYRVAVLSQPDWRSCAPWRQFGRPRLFFGISPGNVDSMINHYTANKRVRTNDDYSPGGAAGLRPDRAGIVYSQRAKEAYPGIPVVLGGVEASLRRLAHYDYWSGTVKRSILLDSKADTLVYGMGETAVVEIAKQAAAGNAAPRGIRGTVHACRLGDCADAVELPSYEEVKSDKLKFLSAAKTMLAETNPFNARPIMQRHGDRYVLQNLPPLPLDTAALDKIYSLPFERRPHPSYRQIIPAYEMIKDSVTIHRGCFGGCTFCSLALHQGKIIQSRSEHSVLGEVKTVAAAKGFSGRISDLGGPSANMYAMRCGDAKAQAACRRSSCVYPAICERLQTDCRRLVDLLEKAGRIPGVKKILVNSGIRMDLALKDEKYIAAIAARHTGGQLSVAPEHVSAKVLAAMHKPAPDVFVKFREKFNAASRAARLEQYLVPYFIAGFPGCGLEEMIELAVFLKQNNLRPQQVNDFIPAPMEYATAVYYTGLDVETGQEVYVPRGDAERRMQRALLQYYKPPNRALVMKALKLAGKTHLAKFLFS